MSRLVSRMTEYVTTFHKSEDNLCIKRCLYANKPKLSQAISPKVGYVINV
jgi:hypothetical protein